MSGRTLGDMRSTATHHCGEDITRKNSEKIACNTLKFWDSKGSTYVLHHRTVIMTWHADGRFEFTPNGWYSSTTSNRVRRFGPRNLSIFTMKGRWYATEGEYNRKYSYPERMIMVDDGFVTDENLHLPDPPAGMYWDLHGRAATKTEYVKQITRRIVKRVRDVYQYHFDEIGTAQDEWQDMVNLSNQALNWAGYTKKAIDYIFNKLYYADAQYTDYPKIYPFPPALSTITVAVKRYLTAHPDLALEEWASQ